MQYTTLIYGTPIYSVLPMYTNNYSPLKNPRLYDLIITNTVSYNENLIKLIIYQTIYIISEKHFTNKHLTQLFVEQLISSLVSVHILIYDFNMYFLVILKIKYNI